MTVIGTRDWIRLGDAVVGIRKIADRRAAGQVGYTLRGLTRAPLVRRPGADGAVRGGTVTRPRSDPTRRAKDLAFLSRAGRTVKPAIIEIHGARIMARSSTAQDELPRPANQPWPVRL